MPIPQVQHKLDVLRDHCNAVGRDYTAMAMAGTPEEVAAQLTPYRGIGFDMFLLMERAPLDTESLRLFMQEVAPRLRAAA